MFLQTGYSIITPDIVLLYLGDVVAEVPESVFGVTGGGERRYELTDRDLSFLNFLLG